MISLTTSLLFLSLLNHEIAFAKSLGKGEPKGPKSASKYAGAVFSQSNDATSNAVIVFQRDDMGMMQGSPVSYATSGQGSGASQSSQGSVSVTSDGMYLFAVNAGSNTISAFAIMMDPMSGCSLKLLTTASSYGMKPFSVTSFAMMPMGKGSPASKGKDAPTGKDGKGKNAMGMMYCVYVVNLGSGSTNGNIAGMNFNPVTKSFSYIMGSSQPLSGASTTLEPTTIQFNGDGTVLMVTEKSGKINTYVVNMNGVAGPPITFTSPKPVPFGFAFYDDYAVVSQATTSSLTSYDVDSKTGIASIITDSLGDGGTAACWVDITQEEVGGQYLVFTANAGSASISSYSLGETGDLTLLHSVAASTGTGAKDIKITPDNKYLYLLSFGEKKVQGFKINMDGTLTLINEMMGVGATPAGIAAL